MGRKMLHAGNPRDVATDDVDDDDDAIILEVAPPLGLLGN